MLLKIVLLICVIAACTLCGYAISESASRRKNLLGKLIGALRILRIEMYHRRIPLKDALAQTQFPLFHSIAESLEESETVFEAWEKIHKDTNVRGGATDCLMQNDRAALDRLFCHLGMSGCEEQAEAIDSCLYALQELLDEAKERVRQSSKLYSSLGFLTGLALAILMI